MILSIAVHGAPYSSQSASSAVKFAEAAVAAGHEIYRVFFYHDGVRTGDALAVTPQDEEPIIERWRSLQRTHDCELALCISAALKRGMLNAEESQRYDKLAASIAPEFTVVGLGQLIDAIMESDRFVTFAA